MNNSEREILRKIQKILLDIENLFVIEFAQRNISKDTIDIVWSLRNEVMSTRRELYERGKADELDRNNCK
jgi:hypothetical protein